MRYRYKKTEITKMLSKNGFQIVDQRRVGHPDVLEWPIPNLKVPLFNFHLQFSAIWHYEKQLQSSQIKFCTSRLIKVSKESILKTSNASVSVLKDGLFMASQ